MPLYRYYFLKICVLLWCYLELQVEAVAPTFLVPIASTAARSVDENSPKDTSILTVEGQDGDGDTLTFSISTQSPMSPPFELNSATGLFKTPNGLDAETTQSFVFTFGVWRELFYTSLANENGSSYMMIHILNYTDYADEPWFLTHDCDSIPVEPEFGDLFSDIQQNNQISKDIFCGVGEEYVACEYFVFSMLTKIQNWLVQITALTKTDMFHATSKAICVSDGTRTVDSVPFTVNINDINDNAPQFVGAPYSASLLDSVGNGTSVVNVTTTDADITPATISYSITGGNTGTTFAIDTNGQITVATSGNLNGATTYTLHVQASDGTNTNSVTVTVTVSVDYCFGDPFVNGVCINGNTNYTCNYSAGYIGVNCSQVDFCATKPCQNGGTCASGATTHTCTCASVYTGTNCTETIIDDSDDDSPHYMLITLVVVILIATVALIVIMTVRFGICGLDKSCRLDRACRYYRSVRQGFNR